MLNQKIKSILILYQKIKSILILYQKIKSIHILFGFVCILEYWAVQLLALISNYNNGKITF